MYNSSDKKIVVENISLQISNCVVLMVMVAGSRLAGAAVGRSRPQAAGLGKYQIT